MFFSSIKNLSGFMKIFPFIPTSPAEKLFPNNSLLTSAFQQINWNGSYSPGVN